jgi:hypothetical protein
MRHDEIREGAAAHDKRPQWTEAYRFLAVLILNFDSRLSTGKRIHKPEGMRIDTTRIGYGFPSFRLKASI